MPAGGMTIGNPMQHMMPAGVAGPMTQMASMGGKGGMGGLPMQMPPDKQFYGVIKSYTEEKGWGHISCPQTREIYQKDMFVLRSAFGGVPANVGDKQFYGVIKSYTE